MIIIRNARILQFFPEVCSEPVTITIDGTRITAVEPTGTVTKNARTVPAERMNPPPTNGDECVEIDAGGRYVMPGPVCSHHHFYSWLARGMTVSIGPTPDFVSILKQVWWRLDSALTREVLAATGAVAALETVRGGITAVIDHHASPGYIDGSLTTLGEGFREVGLRGILCYETTDRHGPEGMRAGVAENARFAGEVAGDPAGENRLLEAAIGAHAPFTNGEESLALLGEVVRSTDRGLHIHVAEDRFDPSHSRLMYGREVIERLELQGLLNPRTIIAHGIYLTDADIELINSADATLAHNCRSNMNNGVGYNERLPCFRNVVLGTDGIGSNVFEELRCAFFKHRDAGGPLGPQDFARFLHNGNTLLERYFERPFGRIEAGATADVVISDYQPPTPMEPGNLTGHLLYGMQAGDIRTSIVNGRIVMRDRVVDADTDGIFERARSAARDLWKAMEAQQPA